MPPHLDSAGIAAGFTRWNLCWLFLLSLYSFMRCIYICSGINLTLFAELIFFYAMYLYLQWNLFVLFSLSLYSFMGCIYICICICCGIYLDSFCWAYILLWSQSVQFRFLKVTETEEARAKRSKRKIISLVKGSRI